ncbi:MAG TPA: FtsX-like permease family protein [Thermoanaerobaculia bacterium]|nr:FtsX-like permease family protein [Thermoanaerobaculia bacterium]
MRFLPLILTNFKRHKLRTTLTLLSVIVAFILFGYLAAIGKAFDLGVSIAGQDRLIVRHKVSLIQLLPASYEADMEKIEGVANATHSTWFGGVYQEPRNFFAQMAVEPDEFMEMHPEFVLPADQRKAWEATKTGAVVGRVTAERFGFKVGQKVPLQATIWRPKSGGSSWTFDLVGIFDGATKETDTSGFLFRSDYLQENNVWGEGLVGWYIIRVTDPARAEEVAKKIDEQFANSPAETKTESEGAFLKAFAEQMGNIGAIIRAILTAVFFTILLVAGNTMAQSVRERISELGVMKAIGFSDAQVLAFVLIESLLIAVVGGAIGLVIAWFAIAGGDPTGGALPVFFFPPADIVLGVIFAIVLGLVTGAIPAWQAMRLNPVEALRRE